MTKLVFIYNADSGLANALLDTGRRIFQPKDYPCALCMVTYGPFGMKPDWKRFISGLPYEVEFLHKDELQTNHHNIAVLPPALLLIDGQDAKILLDQVDFARIKSLDQLKSKVSAVI